MKYTGLFLLSFLIAACNADKKNVENVEDKDFFTNPPIMEATYLPDEENTDVISSATAVNNYTVFNGTLIIPPQNHATVTLTIGGTVKNTSVLPGEYVKKGTILAVLENHEFIDLQQSYLEAYARTEFLEAEYERQTNLSEQEAAPKKRSQESKAEFLSMKSRMEAAAAQLQILGVSTDELLKSGIRPFLEVKAPLSGYITGMKINIGKHINAGESICDIVDKGEAMLCLTAYEKDLDGLEPGVPVSFHVNGMGDQLFSATIISVGQEVDVVNRSLETYARVKETNSRFRPGMYVTAQIKK